MDKRQGLPGWLALVAIALITALALVSPHPLSPEPPAAVKPPRAAAPRRPAGPAVQVWLSTADRHLRLARQPDVDMAERETLPDDILIDTRATYQSMVGFGAAITDAAAWLLQNRLTGVQREALLRELFGPPPGLNMAMTRLTIGASDFSLKPYTLDDMPTGETDPSLAHFNMTPNLPDVIPTVREALAVNPQLRIIASPWSAPAWMKTSANLISGELLPPFESVYADYLVKYVEAYRGYGIPDLRADGAERACLRAGDLPGHGHAGRYAGPFHRSVPGPEPGTPRAADAHPGMGPQLGRTAAAARCAGRSRRGALRPWHCVALLPRHAVGADRRASRAPEQGCLYHRVLGR